MKQVGRWNSNSSEDLIHFDTNCVKLCHSSHFDSYRCTLKMINPIKDFKTFSLTQAQLKGVKSEDGAV